MIIMLPNSAEKQQPATRKPQNSSGLFSTSLKCEEELSATPGTHAGSAQLPTTGKSWDRQSWSRSWTFLLLRESYNLCSSFWSVKPEESQSSGQYRRISTFGVSICVSMLPFKAKHHLTTFATEQSCFGFCFRLEKIWGFTANSVRDENPEY